MTIALLCNNYPPARDGVGDYSFQLAKALEAQGAKLHVIFKKTNAPSPQETTVRLHPIDVRWGRPATAQILQLLREIQADWVGLQYMPYGFHSRGMPFYMPDLAGAIRQAGIQLAVTFHEVQVRPQGIKGRIRSAIQGQIAKALCREADLCFTSIEFYQNLLRSYRQEIIVLPVGSNISPIPISPEKRAAIRQEFFPNTNLVISTFGQRDLSALLEAVVRLEAAGLDVGLLVCGQTAPVPEQQLPTKLHCTGYLPAAEISQFLQSSDLFVLPDVVSLHGAGGSCNKSGSLAAAYAAGLPVIGTRGDMNNLLLQHQENIWLAEDARAANLYTAIRELLSKPYLLEQLRYGSRCLYQQQLNWDQIAAHYYQHLNRVFAFRQTY